MFKIAPWDLGKLTVEELMSACDAVDRANREAAARK
jgi:hypothetical protein